MRLLLDTHALLWFVADAPELSAAARRAIEDGANDVFISVASAWEIAIKVGIGKLSLDAPSVNAFFDEQMATNGFAYLSIEPAHVFHAGALPLHHRDPFDRLLNARLPTEGVEGTLFLRPEPAQRLPTALGGLSAHDPRHGSLASCAPSR